MDSCKLGTCDALKQAEARVREMEAENVRLRPRAEIAGSLLTRTSKAEKRCRELEEELTLCLKEAPVGILAAICDMNKILGLEMPKTSYTEIPPAIQAVVDRVREMDATIDAMAEAHAHDDQALTAAYLNGAHAGKKQAEAERDALRERCRKLDAEIKLITNSYKAEHDEVIRLRMHNTTESAK